MTSTVTDVCNGIEINDVRHLNNWLEQNKSTSGISNINYSIGGKSTVLAWAVKKANVETISYILGKDANINVREIGGATPLLLAIHLNRLDVVECLVRRKADVNLGDSYGTPLTAAVHTGNVKIATFLIDNGASTTATDVAGRTPFVKALEESKLEILEIFLKKNIIDSNTINKTPLALAAEIGNVEVLKLLLHHKVDINKLNSFGNTALVTAVQHKQFKAAQFLIAHNANVCKVGSNGKTPLLWAVHNEDLKMIELLLDNGANFFIDTVFLDAIATKNLEVVQLLKKRGALIRVNENGITPLQKALEINSIEIAKFLIENGAEVVDDLNKKEIATIMKFLQENNSDMVKLLTENGARLNDPGDCGQTLLTKVVEAGNFHMVQYFLNQGANVNQANKKGLTPLAIAHANNDFQIFQYLVKKEATLSKDDQAGNAKLARVYQVAVENKLRRRASGEGGHESGDNGK